MKEISPLKDPCREKKLTNHSVGKTMMKKLKSSGIPKCEIKNTTGRPRTCQRAWRLWLRRRTRAADHFTSHWQLYPANFTASLCAPGHAYIFSHFRRHLEHPREWCSSEEHKWYKARIQVYLHGRIRFWVIWKRFERCNFVWKWTITLCCQSLKFVSRPRCPGIFVQK